MLDTLLKHLDMVRLSVGALALMAVVACNGLVSTGGSGGGGGGSGTPEEQAAITAWLQSAQPALTAGGCFGCHAGTDSASPPFLVGSTNLDIRTTLIGFTPQVVNLSAPQVSQLITKGAHEGPALASAQETAVLDWIMDEATAAASGSGSGSSYTAGPFVVNLCTSGTAPSTTCPVNNFDLSSLIPGSSIQFVAQPLSDSIYVSELMLVTGPMGAYINHPLFVSVDSMGDQNPDDIDRFNSVELDIQGSGSAQIGGGAAGFDGFLPTNKLEITFQAATIYNPADATGSGSGSGTLGCKALPTFVSDVVPVMSKALTGESNYCEACHSSGTAQTNMNLSNLTTASDQQTDCNSVLTQVTFAGGKAAATSPVLLSPEPGQDANHLFHFASMTNYTTFANAISTWAAAEDQ
jgi:hypothetical protein